MDWLLSQDHALLFAINGAHGRFLDGFMWLVSEKWAWLWLYGLLLVVLYKELGWRTCLLAVEMVGLVILASDQIASGLLKPLVQRLRPCHENDFAAVLHLVDGHCGGQYGFASSHAANFFALAVFLTPLLRTHWNWLGISLYVIAFLVGYSRVYLAAHYPSDVLAGMGIGAAMGFLGMFVFRSLRRRLNFPQPSSK